MLQLIDQRWRDHLTEMAHLREGINLRAMGQRDPLTEWQQEGFELFSEMVHSLNVDYIRYVMHVEVTPAAEAAPATEQTAVKPDAATPAPAPEAAPTQKAPAPRKAAPAAPTATEITASKGDPDEADVPESATSDKPFVKDEWDRTPRNAPCPCGSGKKFKQCHGVNS
jgi:preprotein translocase subunit SecA